MAKKLKAKDLERTMTNVELKEIIGKSLKKGSVIVVDKIPSENNEEYVNIYVVQNVDDLPSSSKLPVTAFEKKALGWDSIMMRARFNAITDYADELELGEEIEDAKIRVFDALEPAWADQEPRKDKDDNIRANADGEPIYRNTHVVDDDEFDDLGGHSVIDYVIADEEEAAPAKKSKKKKDFKKGVSREQITS